MNKIFKFILIVFFNFLFLMNLSFSEEVKIKIGLLVPLTGENAYLGKQLVKSVRLALKDLNNAEIEIYPKDTRSDPNQTLLSAIELEKQGINLVIGPIFYENLIYLEEIKNITFLSLTNKTLNLPKNVISTGINSTSQINAIKSFLKKKNKKINFFNTIIKLRS